MCLIVHGAGLGRESFSVGTKPIGALESIACKKPRSQFGGSMRKGSVSGAGEMDGPEARGEGMAELGGMCINFVVGRAERWLARAKDLLSELYHGGVGCSGYGLGLRICFHGGGEVARCVIEHRGVGERFRFRTLSEWPTIGPGAVGLTQARFSFIMLTLDRSETILPGRLYTDPASRFPARKVQAAPRRGCKLQSAPWRSGL
jgi:hypothetical protein